MVIRHFLKWIAQARVEERAAAATALANAFLANELAFEERCEAEAALTYLLDDPAPKVRHALAEAMALSHHAPRQIIAALSCDQPEIAALIILRSPLLDDRDLIERVRGGDAAIQKIVAQRPYVSMAVAAAIAEFSDRAACLALLGNGGADIPDAALRRLAERHGASGSIRASLLQRRDLCPALRHALIKQLGETLMAAPIVRQMVPTPRAERLSRENAAMAAVALIDRTPTQRHGALVDHLRQTGELTSGFLVRIAAQGKMDFFACVLARLSGRVGARVNTVLAGGSPSAVTSLFRAAGLDSELDAALLAALTVWRDVANGRIVAGVQEASWTMLKAAEASPALAAQLRAIHLETLRDNARRHALELAA